MTQYEVFYDMQTLRQYTATEMMFDLAFDIVDQKFNPLPFDDSMFKLDVLKMQDS